jgi:predicted nucleotidyltransferase
MTSENWHEERDRLTRLLESVGSGKVTHVDEEDFRELQRTTPENVAALKRRLAKLNALLGEDRG